MADNKQNKPQELPTCLVIMPFSDPKGYDAGHFRKIYDQVLAPAIEMAGYTPHRIDENAESTMIHGKLLDKLINAPMVLCDLSSKNPNVLYELGIRHAFDKPVVLVQEKGQERIFDIAGLTTAEYRKERLYDEVIEDQEVIAESIRQTAGAEKYSIMSLVQLSPANINRGRVLSGEDRVEILLADISHRLNRIEEKAQKERTSTFSSWQQIGNTSIGEDIERRLLIYTNEAKMLVNILKHRPSEVSDLDIASRIRRLEAAIIDCQHERIQNADLVNEAKETLLKLRGLVFASKEAVGV